MLYSNLQLKSELKAFGDGIICGKEISLIYCEGDDPVACRNSSYHQRPLVHIHLIGSSFSQSPPAQCQLASDGNHDNVVIQVR
jgi:hypothetical protein